jgi:23S rRNA G2445 N2-methylase RlmL
MATTFTYRVRAPKGLESTLIRELKQLNVSKNIKKVKGR